MNKILSILAENRDVLIIAEIACWLHMIGKYTKEFIEGDYEKATELPNGLSQNLLTLLEKDLLQNTTRNLPIKDLQMPLVVEEFVSKHELGNRIIKDDPNAFNKLLNDSHGRGSGIEKGVLKNDAYSTQNNSSIHISTAFGYEKNPIDANLIDQNSNALYPIIEDALNKILQIGESNDIEGINEIRKELISALYQHFNKSIGDTRRPINDVTLWDQTISSVAFFKAELAEALINGYKNPFDKKNKKYTFRYLHVTFDGESYVAKGTGIGDVISRRELVDEAFDRAKSLIEVEYPLGLEIYRDTNGITFLIPELDKNLKINELFTENGKTLIQEISDEIVNLTNYELTPFFYISEKSSRNLYDLGSMISKKLDGNIPSLKLQELWTQKAELCPSCGIRPVDVKSIQKKLCKNCSERITGRGKRWAGNRKDQTVWIDEIADSTGKIALLIFGFNLNSWVNNTDSLSTFRNLKKTVGFSFADLTRELSTSDELNSIPSLKSVGKKYVLNDLKTVDGLYNFMVGSEDLDENKALEKHEKLALAIWRKPPSFARVRRVWETTSKFWDEALTEIKEVVGTKDERFFIRIKPDNLKDLNVNNAYEAIVNGTKFTVFFEKESFEESGEFAKFVIIENLELLAKKLDKNTEKICQEKLFGAFKEKLKDKEIDFYDSNNPTTKITSSNIIDIESESCNYSPVIEITKDPERFMVLVPADKALEIARKIKKKYEREMGKVRNRLPMNLGIVYAGYHTALPAIMDAGRRLMQIDNKEEKWILAEQPEEYSNYFKLSFQEGQVWKIPLKMGDCSEDVWYPYFYVVDKDKDEIEFKKRSLSFKGPTGKWLVHVSELEKGDEVLVTPSYFDYEYLSSASQRFEISYNNDGKRRSKDRSQRPYYLDYLDEIERVWTILSTRLSNSQMKKLNTLVEEKRREWALSSENEDNTFKSYVENVVDNLKWKQSLAKHEKEKLVDFCVNRKLSDVLEIHMSILKDKSEVTE